MKTLTFINQLLQQFETKFGYRIQGAEQQSEAWFIAKLGVISASNAKWLLSKGEGRETYMAQLVGQVCTGLHKEINGAALDWGNQNEAGARAAYEFETDSKIVQLPFVFKDDLFREGCSPDGIVNDRKGTEIKCPYATENYIKFLCAEKMSPDWEKQAQYTLRIMEADLWDFSEYDPRMKLKPMKTITVERNPKIQALFDEAVPEFIRDMDTMLEQIGFKFGDQWRRAAEDAKEFKSEHWKESQ